MNKKNSFINKKGYNLQNTILLTVSVNYSRISCFFYCYSLNVTIPSQYEIRNSVTQKPPSFKHIYFNISSAEADTFVVGVEIEINNR